jgi:hypothetical protein
MVSSWHNEIKNGTDPTREIMVKLLWIGFIIYTLGYVTSTAEAISYVAGNFIQVIGLMCFVPSFVYLLSWKLENKYLSVLLLIYILWIIVVLLRGIKFDYDTIKQLLFDPDGGIFLYLIPLFLLIPLTPSFLKKVFFVILVLGVIYVIYDIVFIKNLIYAGDNMRSQAIIERFTQFLSLPCGYLIITSIYHRKKISLFALFVMALTFLLAVIRARRGLMFMSLSMMIVAMVFYQINNKAKVVNIVLSFFFVLIVAFGSIKLYENNSKTTFSLITERIGQQTRKEVEHYFYRDLTTKDWIIGKGFNGKYFCPGVNEGPGRISIYRTVIETGYLQIILNGGLISLIIMLLIVIPSIIKGIFYSKNTLAKAAGCWIFLFLLYMYPGSMTVFSLYYILVWISVGICYSKTLLNLTDEEIAKELLSRDKIVQRSGF